MSVDGAISIPASLAIYLSHQLAGPSARPAPSPRAVIDAAMARFAAMPGARRGAYVSEWTMYYFAALIAPTITLAVCAGRVPPATIDDLDCVLDAAGRVIGFLPRDEGREPTAGARFEPLVAGHLEPMIASCSRLSGLSRTVLWSNAAVIIDYVAGELRGVATRDPDALREAEALLEGDRLPQLARPYRGDARRVRKVCCLRFRLPDGDECPGICPRGAVVPRR